MSKFLQVMDFLIKLIVVVILAIYVFSGVQITITVTNWPNVDFSWVTWQGSAISLFVVVLLWPQIQSVITIVQRSRYVSK